jgi:hypothetical protein
MLAFDSKANTVSNDSACALQRFFRADRLGHGGAFYDRQSGPKA